MEDVCESNTSNQYAYLCDEMWIEILSRLPIKSLLVCQSVCRSWRNIIHYLTKTISINPQSLPTIGLILVELSSSGKFFTTYICIQTGKTTVLQKNSLGERITVSSGYEKGLLADFCVDFSALKSRVFSNPPKYITMHRGLLLSTHSCGTTYRVYNPVTEDMYLVPAQQNGHRYVVSPIGMIITLATQPGSECEFRVVTLWPKSWKSIDVYCSETRRWERFEWGVLGDIISEEPSMDEIHFLNNTLQNHVAIGNGLDSDLFFSTNDSLVAVKFRGKNPPRIADQYVIPLPQVAKGSGIWGSPNLWDCRGNLHFTYYSTVNGLNIWKHPKEYSSTVADACAWIPLVNISESINLQIGTVFGGGYRVRIKPLASDPDFGVMYFLVNSSVFAYDLANNTLLKIAKISDVVIHTTYIDRCFPLKPCFSSLNALKSCPM